MKILLVSYSFPPAGGVGVLRATSLARHLPGEGIEVDVLTARNASAVGSDPGLLHNLPSTVTVHRTLTLDLPFATKKWLKKVVSRGSTRPAADGGKRAEGYTGALRRLVQEVLLPDPQVTWLPVLRLAARRIIQERNIDLVLVTVPPFSSLMLVEKLRKDFPALPIVTDFRDEWLSSTIDLVSFSRSKRARRIAQRTEAIAIANTTEVVTVTEPARTLLRSRYPNEPTEKFHLIPNGFELCIPARARPNIPRRDGKTIITYIGTLYGSTDPTSLIEAIRTLPLHVRQSLRIRFIGRIEDEHFRHGLLKLGETVELNGFLPQSKALEALSESDYALLISHDAVNVSAKFYDYVGVGKPILAVVRPAGAVMQLIQDLRAGWCSDSSDVSDIRRMLIEGVERRPSLTVDYQPDRSRIRSYERKALAQRYADLLYKIAAKDRAENRNSQVPILIPAQEETC